MAAALSAARIPDLNIQAVIFEPGRMHMRVSINREPAAKGPYTDFDLRKLFAHAEMQ